MKVQDIMTKGVYTVDVETPVKDVLEILAKHRFSGVGVIDEFGDVIGVVSDTDIIHEYAKSGNLAKRKVRDIMMPFSLFVFPEDSIEKAVKMMADNKVHRLFVVKEIKAKPRTLSKDVVYYPVGIITSTDIVKAAGEGKLES